MNYKNDALMQLLKARQMHLEWRSHAEMLIKGMEPSDAMAPVDDSRCEFGQWCCGAALDYLGLFQHYELVAETHHVMHAVYGQIYDLVRQHNFNAAQDKLLQLAQASDALLGAIDLLEQEVLAAPEYSN